MSKNFEGIKTRKFGIEIEMTGLTRSQAAKAMAKVLDGSVEHEGGNYDKYVVTDAKNRKWAVVYDGSINCYNANGDRASKSYSVEMNSPVLEYGDIPLLQEVVRSLRWFCQYHLTHFIRSRIMQRERYDHSRAFFGLPEEVHRWRCRFFCWPSNSYNISRS